MKKLFFGLALVSFLLVSGASAQEQVAISQVQGDGYFSPLADKEVVVQGIVTAIRKRGFYIQSPDDKIDDNQKTSEGIYVFTLDPPASEITVGSLVEVKGTVTEYRPRRERYALFLTEITKPEVKVISNDNPLPALITLTTKDLNPKGQLDQMERFEGMRVKIDEMTVVAPTGGFFDRKAGVVKSDGVFFGVLAETPRPFREPGLDALMVLLDKLPTTLPVFDMNPELIRVDSDGINGGEAIDVTAGATIKNIVGIVDYSFRSYTLLIDPSVKPTVENNRTFVKASSAAENEITIASFNLENFFDDEENSDLTRKETKVSSEYFEKRLKKASLAIRNVVSMPDVLGIVEVENLTVLQKLAARVNADAVAAEQPDPEYVAVLEESNDLRGIDVGFLIKSSKLKVVETKHIAKEIKLDYPGANEKETLFSRPPILVRVETLDEDPESKFAVTVIVNHFKSFRGISDERQGNRVQNKKRMQAELLAKFVADRQTESPDEKIVVIGDFNAFQFNDGYNDQIGTLKGKPEKNVLVPAQNVVETGLVNLVEYITAPNRYSYVFGGSAQVLDHILINKAARKNAAKFGYARLNADFPKVYANDETRPERVSDHDVPVLYLTKGKKIIAPETESKKVESEKSETSSNEKEKEDSEASARAFLFYSFDKKEAEEPGADLDTWINEKTGGIFNDQTTNNLFAKKGGGPNGSKWNPSGDLYISVFSASSSETQKPVVKLNGVALEDQEIVEKSSIDKKGIVYWVKIPASIWNQSLKNIEETDLKFLFDEETIKNASSEEENPVAPLTTGKMIEVEITIGDQIIKKYFHAAFGE